MPSGESNRGGRRVPVSDWFVESLAPYEVKGRGFESDTGIKLKAFRAMRRKDPTDRFVTLESFLKARDCLKLSWSHALDWRRINRENTKDQELIRYLATSCGPADQDSSSPAVPATATFVAGPVILHPRQFFGRERELKHLFGLLAGDPLQCAAIVGPRRSGKTSLLRYMERITNTPKDRLRRGQRNDWLAEPRRYRWVFLDFRSSLLSNPDGVFRCLLKGVGLPDPHPPGQDRFMEEMSQQLTQPTVILMDDIDKALGYQDLCKNTLFWNGLRSLASSSGNLSYILTSAQSAADLAERFEVSGSPFFNIFGHIRNLGPLTDQEARELIQSSPQEFPTDDAQWIIDNSGRWPHRLQKLCYERLVALEHGDQSEAWREKGLEPFESPFTSLAD